MPRVDLAVQASQLVSSAGYLFPIARAWALFSSSHATGSEVRVGFASTSGGPTFATLRRSDGSGNAYTVHSGNGAAWGIVTPPTPHVRVELVGAPASEARSFFLVPLMG